MNDLLSHMERVTQRRETLDNLEMLIDAKGISGVLDMISDICYEKRDHVLTNWQDKRLACDWGKAAARVNLCARRCENLLS